MPGIIETGGNLFYYTNLLDPSRGNPVKTLFCSELWIDDIPWEEYDDWPIV